MRLSLLWAGAVPLMFATSAEAQRITPIEGSRSVSASISAVDAVTHVVDSDSRNTTAFAPFNEHIALDANTQYEGSPSRVDAKGSGTQSSRITDRQIEASVSASAEGLSNDSSARGQGTGNADMYLTFELNRRARYVVTARATATSTASTSGQPFGGVSSLLYIANMESGTSVLSIDISGGETESLSQTGWMPAGPYTFQGDVSALVDARQGHGTVSGSWAVNLRLFCASDFNANGVVDSTDRAAFLNAWNAGNATADIDGNGVVNRADHDVFMLAHGRGC
ncbi:hypothetical protein LZ199_15390 [Myxococcus sp. QH3KD-4-1]|nr:hypothetical protein [Myxococcus qinghaiensis]